jgi:hypothetical protein
MLRIPNEYVNKNCEMEFFAHLDIHSISISRHPGIGFKYLRFPKGIVSEAYPQPTAGSE